MTYSKNLSAAHAMAPNRNQVGSESLQVAFSMSPSPSIIPYGQPRPTGCDLRHEVN